MNAEVRIYRVHVEDEPATNLEIKGLATKEKEIVISDIIITPDFQELINNEDTDSEFSRFRLKKGEPLTEDTLIEYAKSTKGDDLAVVKITNDEETVVFEPDND